MSQCKTYFTKLPQKLKNENIKKIFNAIKNNKGKALFVGGTVRDTILKKEIKDIDIATNLTPKDIFKILKEHNIKAFYSKNSIKHGTVMAAISESSKNEIAEITTLRKDLETFGRNAIVEFSECFKSDAMRRDLTINALYMNNDGKIYDYINGYQDVINKKVIFIGNPDTRIKEDYLRIIRYFRFCAKVEDFSFDEKVIKNIVKNKNGLKNISKERVANEIIAILNEKKAAKSIEKIIELKLLEKILFTPISVKDIFKIENDNTKNDLINKILLLPVSYSDIKNFTNEIYLDKKTKNFAKKVSNILTESINDKNIQEKLYFNGEEAIYKALEIKEIREGKKLNSLIEIVEKWKCPKFPLSGKNLIEIGYEQGKLIGEILNYARTYWINSGFNSNKKELLEVIKIKQF